MHTYANDMIISSIPMDYDRDSTDKNISVMAMF